MRAMKAYTLSMVYAAVLLCSCAPALQRLGKTASSPADPYRERALQLEQQGEVQQAIFAWHIVAQLEKDNSQATQAIQKLKNTATQSADDHFQQGLKLYKSGEYEKALIAFLAAIRYNPDHRKALYYLKTRLQNPEQTIYRVQPGDSFTRIAAKIYKDPSKAFIIAHFNNLSPQKPLLIGTTLLLPAIDPDYLKTSSNIRTLLDQAQGAYQNKRYDEVISLTRKIIEEDPEHAKARQLIDAAYFGKGMSLLKHKRYLAAIEQFKKVRPGYKGRNQAIAKARSRINQRALKEKLSQAQRHLRENKWERVINTAEEILAQDPGNEQAKMLFSNASYNLGKLKLERGEVSQAVNLLSRIDPSYEDTGQLLALARARMKSQAETYYRSGVKHFINEDLSLAIKDWKKALELNPDHPKARQDIENAERLLKKLKALE